MLRHCGVTPWLHSWHSERERSGEWRYRCRVCRHEGYREDFDPDPLIDGLLRAGWPEIQRWNLEHETRLHRELEAVRRRLRTLHRGD